MQPEAKPSVRCTVTSKAKLAPGLGDEAAICAPIVDAAEAAARQAGLAAGSVAVEVELLSAHSIAATIFVEGRALPKNRVDISDRPLNTTAITMLARSVGSQLAQLRSNS